jgi:glycosyltransferase involved in cell wall biosynthesis
MAKRVATGHDHREVKTPGKQRKMRLQQRIVRSSREPQQSDERAHDREGKKRFRQDLRPAVLHVFPYSKGANLPHLLAESICVLLPFRALSYQPQLSVLESIQSGTAVITTALESNLELTHQGRSAILVPASDIEGTIAALSRVLQDPSAACKFGRRAAQKSTAVWNWDRYLSQLTETYLTVLARKPGHR